MDVVSKAALRTFARVVYCRVVLTRVLGYPYISKLHIMAYGRFSVTVERGLSPGASDRNSRARGQVANTTELLPQRKLSAGSQAMATSFSEPTSRRLRQPGMIKPNSQDNISFSLPGPKTACHIFCNKARRRARQI